MSPEEEVAGLHIEVHGSPGYAPDVITALPSDGGTVRASTGSPEPVPS